MQNGRRRVALYKARLTTRMVADAKLQDRRYIIWDDELTGFGARISPSGLRSFIVQYRAREGGRRAASRKLVLGHFPALTPARARSKARAVLRTVAERRASGEDGARPVPTLRHALEGYLRGRPTVSANTRSQYRRLLERHAPQWLDRHLDELAREDVERRFRDLSAHAGPSVANAVVKLLGAVYRAACADHDELRNPVAEWRMGGGKLHRRPRRMIAPPAEVLPRWRRGLEAGVPTVMCDMVWMGLFTGLRVSEVSGLRWEDIDASLGWLRIRETKSGRALELPVTRQVRRVLERRCVARGAGGGWVFAGPGERGPYKRAGDWYAQISEGAGKPPAIRCCWAAFGHTPGCCQGVRQPCQRLRAPPIYRVLSSSPVLPGCPATPGERHPRCAKLAGTKSVELNTISTTAGSGPTVVTSLERPVNPQTQIFRNQRRPSTVRQLTDRQIEVLDSVRTYVREHGVAPSRPEIAAAIGIRNTSTVDGHLTALMKKGWIELRPGSPRFIRLLKDDLPLVVAGPIAAGEPILADERVTARIPRAMADWFPRPPDFFLRVQGDSMNCLGFITGSIVAIKSQPVAESGEVIVAKLEGEVTLKRYVRKDEQRIELHPESTNPEHRPIAVDLKADSFEIAGVAVGALIGDGFNRPSYEDWPA